MDYELSGRNWLENLRNNLLKRSKTYSKIKRKRERNAFMTRIKEKAVEMIQRMPDDNMFYVINILQNLEEMTANKDDDREQAMMAFQDLLKFSGRLSEDFDADKELAAAREEKYGDIS